MRSSSQSGSSTQGGLAGGKRRFLFVPALVLVFGLIGAAALLLRPENAVQPVAGVETSIEPCIKIEVAPRQSVSGNDLQPSPSVVVLDDRGRPAAGVVVSAVLSSGALAPAVVDRATTDSEGKALFDSLKVDKAGAFRLAFTADGFQPAETAEFVVRFGIPRVLTIVREPSSGAAGLPVAGEPAVRITDEAGNPVPGVNIDALLESADIADSKLATVPTNAEGLAVFSDVIIPLPGSNYRLKFDARAAGVKDVISSPFNLTNS